MIPKIIHQIWIGKHALLKESRMYMTGIKNIHPDFEYKFWNNVNIKDELDKKLYQNVSEGKISISEIFNILKINILKKYGGVYIDVDTECIKNISPLIENGKFFCSVELSGENQFSLSSSVFGTEQNGEIITHISNSINKDFSSNVFEKCNETSNIYNSSIIQKFLIHHKSNLWDRKY